MEAVDGEALLHCYGFFLFTLHKADVKILYMICQTQFVTWHVYKYRSDVDLKSFDTSFNSQSTYASSQL